jgi:PAS domain-containing protein
MILSNIPAEFFELLPVPVIVTLPQVGNANSAVVYVNQQFIDELGWDLSDIPDKYTWWVKAYPDPDYQKVVERQWELVVSDAKELSESLVSIDVNIATKSQTTKRFRVSSFLSEKLCPGYNVVVLTRLPNTQ